MPLYFLLLDAALFHEQLQPALTACVTARRFTPCLDLCRQLWPRAEAFAARYCIALEETVLRRVLDGLHYDRLFWKALISELLWFGATAIPELETYPASWLQMLGDARAETLPRSQRSPIAQAYFGSRDLHFGPAFYRPEEVGWHDGADVQRISAYLHSIEPLQAPFGVLPDFAALDDEERADEMAILCAGWRSLCGFYEQAAQAGALIVCEKLSVSRDL